MRPRTRPAVPPAAVPHLTGLVLAGFLLTGFLLTGCAGPTPRPAPDEVVKAATQRLTDACLTRQGLAPPRPGQSPPPAAGQRRVNAALFGTGRPELSVALPTGYVVRAHTDGCLAAAQRRLYGDQRRWFRTSTIVNNLRPEAEHTHRSLTEVRALRGAEIAEWRRLRAHALSEATALLEEPLPTGEPRS
ncbi:hypothetical protein [Streptomyces albireticuli]|uniref:Lipoprotein n=1 Tax=Streptomyces albireticuli TaxID=1940 RepID=A0A2A2CX61_9ACTN|nr:hypothetical protein [Streptomyces albireticuli]MCD9145025.1 hypothetical protein [Streptomyces albireticuli]MCD9164451.1 hypothetical protein [Streptomyces albireticuli]MCD9194162.1 hypothetical protein [Streptomyces albireticuli]PAU44788.1 hypothetical protein CK936_32955 [Streptomyces albireticuli]